MYKVQLNNFEGPIDLLLYFIRRDELDIYDIPISEITREFVRTVEEWKKMHLHVAGDFIVMASTLMRIKAKLLLPRPELDDEGEIIDPRTELIQQLVEYKRFKNAAELLGNLSSERELNFPRQLEPSLGEDIQDFKGNIIINASLYDLAKVFKNAIDNMPVVSQFELSRDPVKLEEQKEFIERSAQDEMNAYQIACIIWPEEQITPLSKETLVVADHIKSQKPNLLRTEDTALGDRYQPPQTVSATVKLINDYAHAELVVGKLALKQKKYVEI